MKAITLRLFLTVIIAIFVTSPMAQAAVSARYVRVESPTGWNMAWNQIEVYSGGANVVLHHGDMFTGTVWPDHNIKTADAAVLTNGTNHDVTQHGAEFPSSSDGNSLNPWFEIDLGKTMDIDKVVLYGSQFPGKQYLDKGHRVLTLMGDDRHVVWVTKFNYQDVKTYPTGIFTFDIAPQAAGANPLLGKVVPPASNGWIPMSWLLNAEKVDLPPDAANRKAHFAARNSPSEVAKFAKKFFPLLDPSLPELKDTLQLYNTGQYQAAFDSWKRYWFAKMARVNLHAAAVGDHYFTYNTQADDLLDHLAVTIGPWTASAVTFIPGEIHWINLPTGTGPDADQKMQAALTDAEEKGKVGLITQPLLTAYDRAGDPRYIQCWNEIMDDWSLNYFTEAAKTPYEVENIFVMNQSNPWGFMMENLSDMAQKNPKLIDEISSTTLARVQLICLEKYATAWWDQDRYTTFIHLVSGTNSWNLINPYFQEFRPGERELVEWRQAFERYMTMATEPDGSPTDIGDEGHSAFGPLLGFTIGRMDAEPVKPAWYTPGWRGRFLHWDDNALVYALRHVSPGGYDHRDGVAYRPERWTSTTKPYGGYKPPLLSRDKTFFAIPEVRRRLDALGHITAGRPKVTDPLFAGPIQAQQKTHDEIAALLGSDKPGAPHLNSDWMPYTGAYYFRGGWDAQDPFLAMVAAGSRGGSSVLFGNRSAFGHYYQYDYNFPLVDVRPLTVDGMPPQPLHNHFGTGEPGTKIDVLIYSERNPAPFRWISTDEFSFGEALFKGAYQNNPVFRGPYDYRMKLDPPGPFVDNVQSSRQILQLVGSRLFIVTDAVEAGDQKPHQFGIPFTVMLSSKKTGATKAFSTDQLQMDEKAGVLRSNNPDGPSQTVYQFSDQPIHYQKTGNPNPSVDFGAYSARLGNDIGIANQEVAVSFSGSPKVSVVSLLSSRPKGGTERVVSAEPMNKDGVVGFHAKLQDGGEIWYQTAGLHSAQLNCGPGTAVGQALLVVSEPTKVSGILLDGKSLSFSGQAVPVTSPDFQFVATAGPHIETTEIYRPIDPVSFAPNRNAFIDSETVTMTSKTPRVEIRYTTDGTDPTLASTLYTAPVKITASTEFAARAYRLGADGKPLPADSFEINGTKFSEPTWGWFYKKELHPAATVAAATLQPGLNYDYLQAPWWRLYSDEHWMQANGGGTVDHVMDLSKVSSNDAYGMRYRGYLKIPQDGLYTFQCPHEFIYMDGMPDYDLRVYVDGEEWYLTQWWHGYGTWSVPLKAGLHSFQVDFAQARTTPWHKSGMWNYYPRSWAIYKDSPTDILLSGPGIDHAPIPKDWLFHEPETRVFADERVLVDSDIDLNCTWDNSVSVPLTGLNEICFQTKGNPADVFGGVTFTKSDGTQVPFSTLAVGAKMGGGGLIVNLQGGFDRLGGALKLGATGGATIIARNMTGAGATTAGTP